MGEDLGNRTGLGAQDQSGRVRPGFVHIFLDNEIGDSQPDNELGHRYVLIGDYAGDTMREKDLADRAPKLIDHPSFDKVLASVGPSLDLPQVADTLSPNANQSWNVTVKFKELKDFRPEALVRNALFNGKPVLHELWKTREVLDRLVKELGRNPRLEKRLRAALRDPEELKRIVAELGIESSEGGAA